MKKIITLFVFALNAISAVAQPGNLTGYEVIKLEKEAVATLVLFGGFPESPTDIEREFKISDIASEYGVNLVLMEVNQRVLVEDSEIEILAQTKEEAFDTHQLTKEKVVIGGYSSGGNLAMLVSNTMMISDSIAIKPKGVFVVDSPLDLALLYEASVRVSNQNIDEEYARNYGYQVQMLEHLLGNPSEDISKYERYSPFTYQTKNIKNLEGLKNVEIRLYAEPALEWSKQHGLQPKDVNAYGLQHFKKLMKDQFPSSSIELITTENKGYDSQGHRNPHHWSIVDKQDLMKWMVSLDD